MFQARTCHFKHFPKFASQLTIDPRISQRLSWPLSSWVWFLLWASVSLPPLPLTSSRACGAISTDKGD